MTQPPPMTDRAALLRQRQRALRRPDHADALFLHRLALADVQERLSEVNRRFTSPVVVSGHPEVWSDFAPVVPDEEVLAMEPSAHDLIVHAMSLHWANDPVGQLVQSLRALKPDGLFLAVFPGGRTLHELRASLAEAEATVTGGLSPRVLPMGEIRDLGALMQRAGFALPVADSVTEVVRYRDFGRLMSDLRAMGETSALAARPRHFTRRSVLAAAAAVYQSLATPEGHLPATFELVFLTGWAPHDSQQKPLRPGSAMARLADVLGVAEKPLPGGG